jgi:hypothetical protein
MFDSQFPDLALRHILQSGVAALRGEPMTQDRRSQVLQALVEMFSDADRGSHAMGTQNFLSALEEPPAFERFVLCFRYLDKSIGSELPNRLAEASRTLAAAKVSAPINPDAKTRVTELLELMLQAMAREVVLNPLRAPKEVRLGA